MPQKRALAGRLTESGGNKRIRVDALLLAKIGPMVEEVDPEPEVNDVEEPQPCHLLNLPDELLLQIFKENCPTLLADQDLRRLEACEDFTSYDFHYYLEAHGRTPHLYDLAVDAFFHDFVLQVDISFHCFHNHRARWCKMYAKGCGLEKSQFRRRITRARMLVKLEHGLFIEEAVEGVMKVVGGLAGGTGLRWLEIMVDTCNNDMSRAVRDMVLERVIRDGSLGKIQVKVALVGDAVS